MGLQIIGAGMSRTGTYSLKLALERLGFGPCYHMHEFFGRPQDVEIWRTAMAGQPVDWSAIFADFQSATDAPVCYFWRELLEYYSDAKVILTERDPEQWYASFRATVYEPLKNPEIVPSAQAQRVLNLAREITFERMLNGEHENQEKSVELFNDHNDAVQRAVDNKRLLVFNVVQGWAPLCRFLDVPVPDEPFPTTNSKAEFRARLGLDNEK